MKIVRTNSRNKDFINLVKQLDAYLSDIDGAEHDFYKQYNSIAALNNVVIVYHNNLAVACGAFKTYDQSTVEIKRMFTIPEYRGQGFAIRVIQELEIWAKELEFSTCILETGKRQTKAVKFYEKNGYLKRSNYGQYQGVENSQCYSKELNTSRIESIS